jgi:glycosyltransferase involved in cell wall biosynthesis
MLRLTIWMNMPSFYQCDLFRALEAREDVDLEVIFAKDLTRDRVELGWHNDLKGFSYRFLDHRNMRADAVRLARSQRKRFHVINGLWSEPAFVAAVMTLAASNSKYAIYSEAPDPRQRRSMIKRAVRLSLGKMIAPRAAGALSISRLAAEFFKSTGVTHPKIYPFGYFRSCAAIPNSPSKTDNRIEVVFVGQLVHRKGIDLLIDAMVPLFGQHPSVFLMMIGSGEMSAEIRAKAATLGVLDRLVFEGVMPAQQIPQRLARADVLVLPSRWDGWGMVVNEALSVGLPVIVSDSCGAADLVTNGVNGFVFRSEDASDLNQCLASFLDRRNDWPLFRLNAAATGKRISIAEVTPYLVKCLNHMTGVAAERPQPPWIVLDHPQAANA